MPSLKFSARTREVRRRLLAPFRFGATGSKTEGDLIYRKVSFDWQQTKLEWIPQQPYASHFVNEINLLLPAGEFWFCRMFNKALPHVTDEKLRQDVKLFVRQEAMHAQAHGGAVERYLNEHGMETESATNKIDWLFRTVLADTPFGKRMPKRLEREWLVFRLGIIAAIEHLTCVLGNYILDNEIWEQEGADEVLLDLLKWHGAEEIEHRSVAFDLYRHLGGTYISRYYLSLIVFPLIIGLWVDGASHLMKQDPELAKHKPSVARPWIWVEWLKHSHRGLLPSPFWMLKEELKFFNPWYDPVTEGSTEQALAYLENSPAYLRSQQAPKAA